MCDADSRDTDQYSSRHRAVHQTLRLRSCEYFACVLPVVIPSPREIDLAAFIAGFSHDPRGNLCCADIYKCGHVQVSEEGGCQWWAAQSKDGRTCSMFPLLKREGLALPYFIVTALWNWIVSNFSQSQQQQPAKAMKRYTVWASFRSSICWHALTDW